MVEATPDRADSRHPWRNPHVQRHRDRQDANRHRGVAAADRRDPIVRGRRPGRSRLFHAELQGRPGAHGPGADHQDFSHGSGSRFRRDRRRQPASGSPARRQGAAERLGRRREPHGRAQPARPRQGRVADAASRGLHPGAGHGDRHGRLHGDAEHHGAGAARHRAGRRRDRGHRRGGRGRQHRREPSRESSAIASWRAQAGRRRPITSGNSGPRRSSTGRR